MPPNRPQDIPLRSRHHGANKQRKPKSEPRSYVTRDTALLAYFRHRGIAPPEHLAVWYHDESR